MLLKVSISGEVDGAAQEEKRLHHLDVQIISTLNLVTIFRCSYNNRS